MKISFIMLHAVHDVKWEDGVVLLDLITSFRNDILRHFRSCSGIFRNDLLQLSTANVVRRVEVLVRLKTICFISDDVGRRGICRPLSSTNASLMDTGLRSARNHLLHLQQRRKALHWSRLPPDHERSRCRWSLWVRRCWVVLSFPQLGAHGRIVSRLSELRHCEGKAARSRRSRPVLSRAYRCVGEGMSVNVVTSDMARWVAEDVSEDGISGFESLE